MSLASLVDKPLMQNPLAGGSQLGAGNKLPELNDPFSNITAPGQIPDRYKKGFEEFYRQNPDDYMRIGGQAISYVTTPQGETIQFGDTGGATNFRRYLESIGETPRDDSLSLAQGSGPLATMEGQTPPGFGPQVIDQRLIDQTEFNQFPGNPNRKPPTRPEQNPNAIRVPADPIQTGGLGDQGLMDRLTSLEQGIGSLQNQIASLFQMGQASDPFGLGGFINTRRY
jgi:hypothetical protein